VKQHVSRRPSPALVVSILALVVAMAGTSYAALKLPKNSVGAKQLKKNAVVTAKIKKQAVTGAKVKKHSLTGQNINLAKLGTVPSATAAATATTAGTATVANGLSALEAPHLVGASGQPGFEEGWHNIPAEGGVQLGPTSFYKDHEGIVHLEGAAETEEGGPVVFTLPVGYRPANGTIKVFNYGGENSIPVYVLGSNVNLEGRDYGGKVLVLSEEGEVSFDGIVFRAES
jgi:hypothetical protein